MRIGEVAARAGVGVQTVRLYERLGLLSKPARLPSGYRDYPAGAARVIRFIKEAQGLGFTLAEIKGLIELHGQGARASRQVGDIARAKIDDINRQIRRLEAMRDALAEGLSTCRCADGSSPCLLLKALDDNPNAAARATTAIKGRT